MIKILLRDLRVDQDRRKEVFAGGGIGDSDFTALGD